MQIAGHGVTVLLSNDSDGTGERSSGLLAGTIARSEPPRDVLKRQQFSAVLVKATVCSW